MANHLPWAGGTGPWCSHHPFAAPVWAKAAWAVGSQYRSHQWSWLRSKKVLPVVGWALHISQLHTGYHEKGYYLDSYKVSTSDLCGNNSMLMSKVFLWVLPIDFLLHRLAHTSNQDNMWCPVEFCEWIRSLMLIRSDTIVWSLSKIFGKGEWNRRDRSIGRGRVRRWVTKDGPMGWSYLLEYM